MSSAPFMRVARLATLSIVLAALGSLTLPVPAGANTPIEYFTSQPSTTQAGGHPDLEVNFGVENREIQNNQSACQCEDAKNAAVRLPAGFIGNPHATPQCTLAEFSADTCAIDSQVGITSVGVTIRTGIFNFNAAIYNLVPPPDQAGLLGFKVYGSNKPQFIILSARTATDYGLDSTSTSIFHGIPPVESLQQVLWGVPADPSHDLLRLDPATETPNLTTAYQGELCNAKGELSGPDPSSVVKPCNSELTSDLPVSSNSSQTPFLQNPTTCGTASLSSLEVLSYDGGITSAESPWPQMTGCDQLSFNPSLYAQPTTTATDTASGIDVDLEIPQQQSSSVPSPSELRAATVVLPPGFSINPNAADGKTSCTDAEAQIGAFSSEEEAQCPEDSKVGSLTIDSSALPAPIPGFVYLGQPQPGNRYRIFLVANGFATHVKLPGTVIPDPQTGQLRIYFSELPQTPLTAFNMHFFGSERGLLATPTQCGTYPVTTTFAPWDASLAAQSSTQYFSLDSGPFGAPCPGSARPFAPGFQSGSLNHTAAAHAPFSIELTRQDGDQNLSSLTVNTPPGLLATLKGVTYCPQSALAAAAAPSYSGLAELSTPSCPASSQIGTATAGAGAGTHPVYLPGKVYLSGPYKGAPLSLAVITPAISGPYDLGNVVVRAALNVNPSTAQITAVSDPLPQIVQGIPLRLRSILINLDRSNFTLNPTNCDPLAVSAQAVGDEGAISNSSVHFQVANCASLAFEPKLALKLSGGVKRSANPALKATVTYPTPAPYANIASTSVTLPHSEFLDNAHIRNPCTRVVFAEGSTPGERCPPGSVIGFAKAETPLLDKPLEGPVYLRSSSHKLPDIVAALKGQIDIELDGRVDSVHERLRTTFENVPDAPVSKFTLSLDGGNKGLLVNSQNLCQGTQVASVKMLGQNGKSASANSVIQTPCATKAKHKKAKQASANRGGGHR